MKLGVDVDKVIHSYKGTMNIDEKEILPGDIDNSPFMDAVRAENKRIDDEIYEICEGIAEVVGFGRHYIIDRKNVADALRKQIPKELDYEGDGYDENGDLIYDYAKCRVCGHDFEYGINDWGCKYCSDCGQALDWGQE